MCVCGCGCVHTLRRIKKYLIPWQRCKSARCTPMVLARAAGNLNYRSMSTNEIRSQSELDEKEIISLRNEERNARCSAGPSGARRSYVKIAREIGLHSASSSKKGAYFLAILHHVAAFDVGSFKEHERTIISLISNDISFRNSRNLSG